ncbi:hypothetical protein [Dictyobacter halimunensis]|uniref:hypothetical protein n=1 Tax=Dictyobacter halimunensis TaxID=3026934 RepID=UPI0030C6A144
MKRLLQRENAPVGTTFNGRPGRERQRLRPTSPHDPASHVIHAGPRGTGMPTSRTRTPKLTQGEFVIARS